jgi:hypothetical protein
MAKTRWGMILIGIGGSIILLAIALRLLLVANLMSLIPICPLPMIFVGVILLLGAKRKPIDALKKESAVARVAAPDTEAQLVLEQPAKQTSPKVLKKGKWDSPEGIGQLLQEHVEWLSKKFQGWAGEKENQEFFHQLLADNMLAFASGKISQNISESLAQKKVLHAVQTIGDWYIAVTVCPWLNPDEVKANLGKGYMDILEDIAGPAFLIPEGKNLAHWVYCFNGSQVSVNLTLIPNPKGSGYKGVMVFAEELLTPQERQKVGLPSLPGQSGISFAEAKPSPVPGKCYECQKPLHKISAGLYMGNELLEAGEQIPYPCKSCGTNFCVNCIVKIQKENNKICPYCQKPIGW